MWPLRSSRQQFDCHLADGGMRDVSKKLYDHLEYRCSRIRAEKWRIEEIVRERIASSALFCGVIRPPWGGVVKPHGRLGPLRSEGIAPSPRAAYRRDGLSRPFRELKAPGRAHLGDGFPLRCFQRLSVPIIATRRCTWRHSRDTSGSSDPVLSY